MLKHNLFKFPTTINHDIEGFVHFYPKKFPKIMEKYTSIMEKYYNEPEQFRKHCIKESQDMIRLSKKIVDTYKNFPEISDTNKLIVIDQRIHKLSCFKFWIYNYLYCEGSLQQYHIEKIKTIVDLIATGDSVEEIESHKLKITKALIQTDYTDTYVTNLLNSKKFYLELKKHKDLEIFIKELDDAKTEKVAYVILEKFMDVISKEKRFDNLLHQLEDAINKGEIMKNNIMVFSQIMTYIKFKDKVEKFEKSHVELKHDIEEIFKLAKYKLSKEDYGQLEKSYKMIRLLAECKDLFGESDNILLSFWFALINEIANRLESPYMNQLGQGASFYNFIWCATKDGKNLIYTQDNKDFNEEDLFIDL